MINSSTYENIIKVIGNKLLQIIGLDRNRLFNGVSAHGSDLLKVINESEYTSFSLNDCFIVFVLEENNVDRYFILRENDGSMSSHSQFRFSLKIYGNACHDVSQTLLMAFKDENLLQEMYDNSVYILNLTFPKFSFEPINNTLWPRCDIDINLKVRFNKQINSSTTFFKVNEDKEIGMSNDINIHVDDIDKIIKIEN